ncbi:type II toxin-antitoxin system RelE/ParE family toxin [Verrucomicrobiaceae bacterium N1E253]|uniref:Type II toxin-antitoxin system RelE/ParE family toxin n=1 Tax=Oceaniferula marina TaxID=2748318 RepID=A0A851GBC6_9BACT|nr:type II toxin-antitoxin system mRNA interferase toxin, RelE/StbE family [Oceaniferula marina]NWK54913.1 type II toxin-antitoxin system RelE/ParE family toxin [Oceaniferula marina]
MSWDYSFTSRARKELKKLGHESARKIIRFLDERVCEADNPRQHGKALKGSLDEYWRYRIKNFQILCEIKDDTLIVLVVKVGHRRNVYD